MVLALNLGITHIGFAVFAPVFGLDGLSRTRDESKRGRELTVDFQYSDILRESLCSKLPTVRGRPWK